MNENAHNVISSDVTDDLISHSPYPVFAHESSVLGCIGQVGTVSLDDSPLGTPCVLQVSGWTDVENTAFQKMKTKMITAPVLKRLACGKC